MHGTKVAIVLVVERHVRIVQAIQDGSVVATTDLANLLNVSSETIRRDLADLEAKGALVRVRGGAMRSAHLGDEAPFVDRSDTGTEAKDAIGRLAAGLVSPGQTVVIDVGTTAMHVARALVGSFSGVVLTCSVLVANELADAADIEVQLSGGRMRRGDLALSGPATRTFFEDVFADVAFLGSGGVHTNAGLTDFYADECYVRRVIMRNSAANYVLADSSKHQRIAPYRVASLDAITGLITEHEPPADLDQVVTGGGGRIISPVDEPTATIPATSRSAASSRLAD